MSFEAATSTAPTVLHVDRMPDAIALLPAGAQDKLRKLRLRFHDLNKLIPKFADINEVVTARVGAEQRLARLKEHPSRGGFNLDDGDQRVIAAKQRLQEFAADERRLTELESARSQTWRTASAALSNAETWLKGGIPGGATLQDFETPEPKLNRGEDLLAAIQRHGQRCVELRENLKQIRGALYPADHCKRLARAQIETLAARGKIDVLRLVKHGSDLVDLPTQHLRVGIHGAPGASGFVEATDAGALFAWTFKDALIAKIDAEIDGMANDKAALTVEVREKREAAIAAELLTAERALCSLVWRAQSENLPAEFAADINPVAVLAVQLVARADKPSSGTSRGLSWAHR